MQRGTTRLPFGQQFTKTIDLYGFFIRLEYTSAMRGRQLIFAFVLFALSGCTNDSKLIEYPRISNTAEPPSSYLCIGAVSMFDNNKPGEPLFVLRQNKIKHEVYGDIWHTMISLYCSPDDIESAVSLLESLTEEHRDMVYLLDEPVEQ